MDVAKNREIWDREDTWAPLTRGDEWSSPWGSVSAQWYGTLLPRIHAHLPADTILEIACGYGRWTEYLRRHCRRLIVLDLSEICVAHCRKRFAPFNNIEYHVNDGKSLEMIQDASIDFAFSFDSLVHADQEVMDAYIAQLRWKLKPGGHAFLHHSNFGEYMGDVAPFSSKRTLKALMNGVGIIDRVTHWRDPHVSAAAVRKLAAQHQMRCVSQEIIKWLTRVVHLDCLSVLANDWSPSAPEKTVIRRNSEFMREAANLKLLSDLYVQDATNPARAKP